MNTKYGFIATKEESGIKKLDFENCKFNDTGSFFSLMLDKECLKRIFGY